LNQSKSKKLSYQKIIRILWAIFIISFLFGLLYIFAVKINLFNLFGGQPDLRELENPKYEYASEIFSADKVSIGKFYLENREPVAYEELPEYLIKALIATEDVSFEKHSGIDPRGLARVILHLGRAGGGSTLSQQLAKNLFDTRTEEYQGHLSGIKPLNMLNIKIKEWLLAIKIERQYTKKEIITMYLNTVPFGKGAYGIKVASRTYFNKLPKELSIPECAMMVGLVNGPAIFNPINHPERALNKRNFVLYKLLKYGHISEGTFNELKRKPLRVDFRPEIAHNGAAYFKDVLQKYVRQWCIERDIDLYTAGLKIYTTIDSRMQAHAERAMRDHMRNIQNNYFRYWRGKNPWTDQNGVEIKDFIEKQIQKSDLYKQLIDTYGAGDDSIRIVLNRKVRMKVFSWDGDRDTLMSPIDSVKYYQKVLHAGLLSVDKDGQVKAWVGGINHYYFKYDHVQRQKRQPGSTFKPIVYAVGIENGLTPCSKIPDVPVTVHIDGQRPWSPQNDDHKYSGEEITLFQAIGQSKNLIAAQLIKQYGIEQVVDMAGRLGIDKSKIEPYPSIALGSSPASLFEMTAVYNTFLNEGTYVKPQFLLRIEDKFGRVLYGELPVRRDAINEDIAFQMIHLLKAPIEVEGGTARNMPESLKNSMDIAGKTGTTQNNVDAWFMGFTKDITTGVWVGGNNSAIHLLGSGATMAMPIWAGYVNKVYNDSRLHYTKGRFTLPDTEEFKGKINCDQVAKVDSLFTDVNP
jgi:penicillin-binding protein 1A